LFAVAQVKLLEFSRNGVFDSFAETASGQQVLVHGFPSLVPAISRVLQAISYLKNQLYWPLESYHGKHTLPQLSRYINVLQLHSVRVSEEDRIVTRDVGVLLRWL